MKMTYQMYDPATAGLIDDLVEEHKRLSDLLVALADIERQVKSQQYKVQKIEHDLRVRINKSLDEEKARTIGLLQCHECSTPLTLTDEGALECKNCGNSYPNPAAKPDPRD